MFCSIFWCQKSICELHAIRLYLHKYRNTIFLLTYCKQVLYITSVHHRCTSWVYLTGEHHERTSVLLTEITLLLYGFIHFYNNLRLVTFLCSFDTPAFSVSPWYYWLLSKGILGPAFNQLPPCSNLTRSVFNAFNGIFPFVLPCRVISPPWPWTPSKYWFFNKFKHIFPVQIYLIRTTVQKVIRYLWYIEGRRSAVKNIFWHKRDTHGILWNVTQNTTHSKHTLVITNSIYL